MTAELSAVRRLLKPLNLAAYITWLAIFVRALRASPAEFVASQEAALSLLLGFLLAFLLRSLIQTERRVWQQHVLLALQGVAAVALCVMWRNDAVAPILTIIVVAQAAMSLTLPLLICAVVTMDVALWYVFNSLQHIEPWLSLLIFGGFQTFAALTAWYARSAEENAAALQRTNAHLLATRSLLEESARDQERLRLARELHDVAGHKLTALKLNLAVLQRDARGATAPELAAPELSIAARLAAELLDDVRAVVAQLREYDGMDLRQALTQLVVTLPRPRVHLDLPEDARVDGVPQAEALIRAVQEALTNVARHANADNAWVSLRREGNAIHLHVHDDGRGSAELREGHGIKGMRERFAALGGSLQLSRATAGGLALDVTLPLS